MNVRRVQVLAGMLAILGVFAIGNYVLGFERWTIHWWANSFWTLASLLAGLKCLHTARKLSQWSHRTAWTCFGAGCLIWFLGMIAWNYSELVYQRFTPFPGLADVGYLGLPPLFIAGFYFYGAQAPARHIDVKQLCNLGILLCSTIIVTLMVLLNPLSTQDRSFLYMAVAVGYPIFYFTSLLYGLACLWLYTSERDRTVLLKQ